MDRLANKVALITGAASGIGRATAELFARAGARVALADLDLPAVSRVAECLADAGAGALALPLDVAVEADWQQALTTILGRWSRLDVLANVAGISAATPLGETSLADWRRLHAVNLDGVFLGTRAAVRAMAGRGGVVVNVASLAGLDVFPGAAAYSSSKAAVIHFSRCAAAECAAAGNGIHVRVLAPGGVRTPMWATVPGWAELARVDEAGAWRSVDPAGEFYAEEEVAAELLRLVLNPTAGSDALVVLRGRHSHPDGGGAPPPPPA